MRNKPRKYVKCFAIIPNDFELSVQYTIDLSYANAIAETMECGATVSEMEIPQDVFDRKEARIAAGRYRV